MTTKKSAPKTRPDVIEIPILVAVGSSGEYEAWSSSKCDPAGYAAEFGEFPVGQNPPTYFWIKVQVPRSRLEPETIHVFLEPKS